MPQDIKSIRCGVNELTSKILIHPNPKTGLEAKFSLQYCLAVALSNRNVGVENFEDEKVDSEDIRKIINKIEMYIHRELKERNTISSAIIDIETKGGKKYSCRIDKPSGSGRSPLTWERLVSKFKDCSSLVLNEEDSNSIITNIRDLERLSNIKKLMGTLSLGSKDHI